MLRLTACIRTTAYASLVFAGAYASAAAEAPKATPTIEGNTIEGVRNARYCEIIPIARDGLHLTATVYNTLGLNDCPAQIWDSITENAMKQRFGAATVLLNGPRYFLMDSITASGATKEGKKIEAGGLELTERATIDVGLLDLLHRPYREQTINRDTVYRFKAGTPRANAGSVRRQPLCHASLFADSGQDADLRPVGCSRQQAETAFGLALRDHDS